MGDSRRAVCKAHIQEPTCQRFGVSFIIDYLRSGVTDCATGRHRLVAPHDFGQSKIRDLDQTNSTRSDAPNELSFIYLILVIRSLWFTVLCGNEWNGAKEWVLQFDVSKVAMMSVMMNPRIMKKLSYR